VLAEKIIVILEKFGALTELDFACVEMTKEKSGNDI